MTATSIDTPALLTLLVGQQRRIVGIVTGLDDDAMRRAVLPSGWSCAGMIQHLTRMTTFWFDAVLSGHQLVDSDDDFELADDVSAEELVERYTEATVRGHDLVRDLPLDTPPAQWPGHLFGPWRLHSLFEVLQHVLVESATHSGHLDAARELIDGGTWDYQRGAVASCG